LVGLLRLENIRITSALRADRSTFAESISFMVRNGLIKIAEDPDHEVVYFDESHRRALDLYRNTIAHYFATPSILARSLLGGAAVKDLEADLVVWHDIFHREFFVSPAQFCPEAAGLFLEHFASEGWTQRRDGRLIVSPQGLSILSCLETQTRGVVECYEAICRVVMALDGDFSQKGALAGALVVVQNAQRLGTSARSEAANDTTFGNAIELLISRGILVEEMGFGAKNARDPKYARGEKWGQLGELHARLAHAATAG
jgi:glycerol-3-phosphate O-acyltransferase